jgi:hypothetical protein
MTGKERWPTGNGGGAAGVAVAPLIDAAAVIPTKPQHRALAIKRLRVLFCIVAPYGPQK